MGQGLMSGHRFGEADAVTGRALALARAAGAPPEIVAHALSTLGVTRAYTGAVTEGIQLAEESVAVAAQGSRIEELHRAYINLSCVLMLEDLRRAARVAVEAAEIASRDGLAPTYGNFLTGNAVASLVAAGEWAQADALLADAVTGPDAEPVSMGNLLVSRIILAAWRGNCAAVDLDLARIDAALAWGGHADMRSRIAVAAAEAATWCRAYAAAQAYVITAADADAATDDLHMRPHVAAVGLRLAAEWPAAAPAAQPQRQLLTRRMLALVADPGCRNAPGYQARAYLRTAEAEASRLAGGPGDPELWRSAVQAWEQVPALHRIAYTKLRLAEALLACRGQRRQAQAELAAARDAAELLGASALAEEVDNLAARARLALAVASQPGPAGRFGLTQREREVLGLVCAGATNRQIAERLFISPKTAALHVSHILAKLGVATRGEAAALAHRLGLAGPTPAPSHEQPARPAGRGR